MISAIDPLDQWYLARHSKLTASENYKLLTPAKANNYWSDGANTYIEQKALEAVSDMWERPELEEVKSLLWGKVYEQPAYESFVRETKNYSMTYLGSENPVFLEYEPLKEESGGTPDVLNILNDGSVDAGAEIKCPRNPVYHFRRLSWKTQWDLREGYPLCYTQIQNLMLITGASVWFFMSFDDRQKIKSKKSKIIEVLPDKKFQDNLDIRLRQAVKEKYKMISERFEEDIKCKADLSKLKM
jgi:hypothetical protein